MRLNGDFFIYEAYDLRNLFDDTCYSNKKRNEIVKSLHIYVLSRNVFNYILSTYILLSRN